MFLQSVSLRNLGSFESAEFKFRPGVVNVIAGENGSGKSQLIGAIIAALIGRPALRIDSGGTGPSTVDVIVREGDTAERLNLSVSLNNGGDANVQRHSEGEHADRSEGVLKLRLLAAWSDPGAPRLLLSEGAMEVQSAYLHAGDFEAAIPSRLKRSREWVQLRESGIMEGARSSGGQIALGVLLRELARRTGSRESFPMIVDGYLERIAEEHVTLCAKVLASRRRDLAGHPAGEQAACIRHRERDLFEVRGYQGPITRLLQLSGRATTSAAQATIAGEMGSR